MRSEGFRAIAVELMMVIDECALVRVQATAEAEAGARKDRQIIARWELKEDGDDDSEMSEEDQHSTVELVETAWQGLSSEQ